MGIQERKERERIRRRNDIITSAEEIFFGDNAESATMDAIAEKAELSKGTLYLYFKNKLDLQYAIAEKGINTLTEMLLASVVEENTGIMQLSDIGDEFVKFVHSNPKHIELILQFELTEYTENIEGDDQMLARPVIDVVSSAIEKGQNDNSIRNDFSEREISIILWSQMIGLIQTILHQRKYNNIYPLDMDNLIKGHFRLVMQGVRPPSQN